MYPSKINIYVDIWKGKLRITKDLGNVGIFRKSAAASTAVPITLTIVLRFCVGEVIISRSSKYRECIRESAQTCPRWMGMLVR